MVACTLSLLSYYSCFREWAFASGSGDCLHCFTGAAAKTSMMKLHKGLVLELCLRKLNPAERKLGEAVAEESSRSKT